MSWPSTLCRITTQDPKTHSGPKNSFRTQKLNNPRNMDAITSYVSRQLVSRGTRYLMRRAGVTDDDDDFAEPPLSEPEQEADPVTEEMFSSWALFILLFLLCSALWSSYYLQQRRIKAIHETVLLIFYGMIVGLVIRVAPGHYIQDAVKFKSGYFFNILLPPIILNSGYELHQANFFGNLGLILTFAIPGTFISLLVLGTILYAWTALGFDGVKLEWVDALAVGATLSATDPVTILSIFNAYKVDPKLYTIIFGESLLNDAISIVMFETCQQFHGKPLHFSSMFEGIGLFLMTFTVSTIIGMAVGILVALILKHSHVRRYPQIETCLVLLFAYQSYFFSNGAHMSGIVSLLFCGITLKHYAYFNMSRRTQIATKYIFQFLAQLSENFIFIYLGLSLFTEVELVFKPLLIIVTFILICIARWCAVFPLSKFLNFLFRAKHESASRRNVMNGGISSPPQPEEISHSYQMMIFWAGLRGAVGVALALGLQGEAKSTLLATVLVVVVLTVIFFGGTTASMLEILGIKTGVVEEGDDSDDEFDIVAPKLAVGNSSSNLNLMGSRRFSPDIPSLSRNPNKSSVYDTEGPANSQTATARSLASCTNSRTELSYNHNDDDELITSDMDDFITEPLGYTEGDPGRLATQSNGALGAFLSAEEHARWFTKFDEEVLKPVLLDTLPHQEASDKYDEEARLGK
ncbi:mitochondrial sodium/hydrogen exchanger [Metschnikowia bicuspidata var. bicuspidata NRRL YB-4993]|uniref:Sodium/hydrogen exchanger n=1 Tax=Metschnikowia bicuspidata var. bicuspidata NRRL YB-4993 TaxID=869754 RepID=A0A1A0HI16_9ASCO|nr:mitochondrial sodium/hydrogen exchanger [Metschnikowia bicuspidata var. bicuspidata NRRL YB-4993]OBA23804.1 mitochondrial sodium/hydrogen exchanger [Metschnikowia bicuspidata var. bicuspidata NRRL YB-4993]